MKKICLTLILLILFAIPKGVFAYSTIKYYDFIFIMNKKGYDFIQERLTVCAAKYDKKNNLKEKYMFYNFSNSDDSRIFTKTLYNELMSVEEVTKQKIEEKKDYSYFTANWMSESKENFKYCFGYNGIVICGISDVKYSEKVKENVNDLFSDNVSKKYSLDKVHKKIKDIDKENLETIIEKLGIEKINTEEEYNEEEYITKKTNVTTKNKNNKNMKSLIFLLVAIIAIISIIFGLVSYLLLRKKIHLTKKIN